MLDSIYYTKGVSCLFEQIWNFGISFSIIFSNNKFTLVKGGSNANNKYVLTERALWTMNFDTSILNGEAMSI